MEGSGDSSDEERLPILTEESDEDDIHLTNTARSILGPEIDTEQFTQDQIEAEKLALQAQRRSIRKGTHAKYNKQAAVFSQALAPALKDAQSEHEYLVKYHEELNRIETKHVHHEFSEKLRLLKESLIGELEQSRAQLQEDLDAEHADMLKSLTQDDVSSRSRSRGMDRKRKKEGADQIDGESLLEAVEIHIQAHNKIVKHNKHGKRIKDDNHVFRHLDERGLLITEIESDLNAFTSNAPRTRKPPHQYPMLE